VSGDDDACLVEVDAERRLDRGQLIDHQRRVVRTIVAEELEVLAAVGSASRRDSERLAEGCALTVRARTVADVDRGISRPHDRLRPFRELPLAVARAAGTTVRPQHHGERARNVARDPDADRNRAWCHPDGVVGELHVADAIDEVLRGARVDTCPGPGQVAGWKDHGGHR
jgi:hypothetical protein